MRLVALLGFALLAGPAPAAGSLGPKVFTEVGIDQRIGARLPLDLVFIEATGEALPLARILDGEPTLLIPAYYRCPNLCGVTLRGMAESLRALELEAGIDFKVVAVSIDPREDSAAATATLAALAPSTGGNRGWHLLTGRPEAIGQLMDAIGFRYLYDPELDQFAHAAGVLVVTPSGQIANYLYGVKFPSRDLRLALVEASGGRLGTIRDQLLLLCYDYQAETGTYSVTVMSMVRVGGLLTLAGLALLIGRSLWRERRSGR